MVRETLLLWMCLSVCTLWVAASANQGNQVDMDDAYEFSLNDTKKFSKMDSLEELCQSLNFFDIAECLKELHGPPEDGNKTLVSQASTIAKFDACNPREQTVALPRDPDPRITVWPICTRVKRCGGCCTSDVFTCSPTATKDKYVKVFKTLLPYPGAHTFQFLGVRIVKLEEHTQCDAQCRIKAHECHKYQKYEPRKCRCRCRDERLRLKDTCTENQIWDDDECNCICPTRNTVQCPEPSVFSETTCKCTLKTSVTGAIDLQKLWEEIDAGRFGPLYTNGNNNNNNNGHGGLGLMAGNIALEIENELDGLKSGAKDGKGGDDDDDGSEEESTPVPETTVPTTTTTTSTTTTIPTTTTTTEPQTTQDPCAKTKCRGVWKPRYVPRYKKCRCLPPIRRRPSGK